ncbi:MAG TPA: tetratricopeptide repeat protein, partial [Candidatus Solibacter sp.]|nr:tetratricopeptide repeat protein [Candidatus Solibacter sp.]
MSCRVLTLVLAGGLALGGQDPPKPPEPPPAGKDQPKDQPELKRRGQPSGKKPTKDMAPPEEDKSSATDTNYTFNPLQAKKDIIVGNLYFKKGSFRAAAGRFSEATKWNEGDTEAWLRLGETEEKLKDHQAAREAYEKYL